MEDSFVRLMVRERMAEADALAARAAAYRAARAARRPPRSLRAMAGAALIALGRRLAGEAAPPFTGPTGAARTRE